MGPARTALGGGAAICVQHAHNHYLQALTDAGIVGLVLFCVMVASWLVALSRGLLRAAPDGGDGLLRAWRVGLFAAVFIHEWPIASASAFTNMPLGGWFFLLLGAGLAEPVASAPILALAAIGPAPISPRRPRTSSETEHG